MNRNMIKEFLVQLRNGLAFCFSWLVICIMFFSAVYGKESISLDMLFKTFILSFWAVLCFILCFKDLVFRKKGFIFRLTLFYALFIPVEVVMFFLMDIFTGKGSFAEWGILIAIIVSLYVICLLIDWIVCRKQGEEFTKQLLTYNERRANELHRESTEPGEQV